MSSSWPTLRALRRAAKDVDRAMLGKLRVLEGEKEFESQVIRIIFQKQARSVIQRLHVESLRVCDLVHETLNQLTFFQLPILQILVALIT